MKVKMHILDVLEGKEDRLKNALEMKEDEFDEEGNAVLIDLDPVSNFH